jgi:hypothetical protein
VARCALRLQDLPDEGAGVHEPHELADARQKQPASGFDLQIGARSPRIQGIPALMAFNHNQKLRTAFPRNHY